jgi:hypothetical protein
LRGGLLGVDFKFILILFLFISRSRPLFRSLLFLDLSLSAQYGLIDIDRKIDIYSSRSTTPYFPFFATNLYSSFHAPGSRHTKISVFSGKLVKSEVLGPLYIFRAVRTFLSAFKLRIFFIIFLIVFAR